MNSIYRIFSGIGAGLRLLIDSVSSGSRSARWWAEDHIFNINRNTRRIVALVLAVVVGLTAVMMTFRGVMGGWGAWFVPFLFLPLIVGAIIWALVGNAGPTLVLLMGVVPRVRYWFFYVVACVLFIGIYAMIVPMQNSLWLSMLAVPILLAIVACGMTLGASDAHPGFTIGGRTFGTTASMVGMGSYRFIKVAMVGLIVLLIAVTIGFYLSTPLPPEGYVAPRAATYGGQIQEWIWGPVRNIFTGTPATEAPTTTTSHWVFDGVSKETLLAIAGIILAVAVLAAVAQSRAAGRILLLAALVVGILWLIQSGTISAAIPHNIFGASQTEDPDWFYELDAKRYNSMMHRAMAGDVVAYKFHLKPGNWYRGLDISVSRDPWFIQNLRTQGRMGLLFMEVHDREGRPLYRGRYQDPDAEVYMQGATMDLMVQGGDGLEPLVLRIRKTVPVS